MLFGGALNCPLLLGCCLEPACRKTQSGKVRISKKEGKGQPAPILYLNVSKGCLREGGEKKGQKEILSILYLLKEKVYEMGLTPPPCPRPHFL